MFSIESFVGVAGQTTYTFLTLRYLSEEHLTVTVDGLAADFVSNAARTAITISGVSFAGGEDITVTRQTPATEAGRLVDFVDLSHVRQSDLDTSSLQLLYIAQEALDFIAAADCLGLGVSGHWDAESLRLTNVADGVADDDLVNKSQLDAVVVGSGNLPAVTAGDNDSSLWVVAGAWAIRVPSQARAHLGLGTAALANVGTGALEVVQFDGSAQYPANDGRNIDLENNAALLTRYRTTVGNVVQASTQTPTNDATATWSQSAASRLTPGTMEDLHNSGDIVVDNTGKKVTLGIGTWEIQWIIRAYNVNAAAGNDQDMRVKVTDDDDTGTQTVYDADYDRVTIESPGATTRALFSLVNIILVKLPAGGTIVLRATNEDGTDIRIDTTRMLFRKVSPATS